MLSAELLIVLGSIALGLLSKWQSEFTWKEAVLTIIRLIIIFNVFIVLGFLIGVLLVNVGVW